MDEKRKALVSKPLGVFLQLCALCFICVGLLLEGGIPVSIGLLIISGCLVYIGGRTENREIRR